MTKPTHLRRLRCDSTFLQPIENVYKRAHQNGERCLRQLNDQIILMRERQTRLISDSHVRNQIALKEYRERIQQIIQRHFQLLERKLRVVEQQSSHDQRLVRTLGKYEIFRDEVSGMMNDLDKYVNMSQAIRTLVNIDLRAFVGSLKSQTDFITANVKVPQLNIETNLLQDINACLQRGINFKENINVPVQPILLRNTPPQLEINNLQLLNQNQQIFRPSGQSIPNEVQNSPHHLITVSDYFTDDCQFNLLHSFDSLTRNLYVVPLEITNQDQVMHIHRSELNCTEVTKAGSKSIITPHGDIYLLGGRNDSTLSVDSSIKRLAFSRNDLQHIGSMRYSRQQHCLCYAEGYIYILNGQSQSGQPLKQCERFNLRTNQCEQITGSQMAVYRASACLFQNRFIFRFGGMDSKGVLVSSIERYDIQRSMWEVINPTFNMSIPAQVLSNFSCKPQCLAIQINAKEILFTCGTLQDEQNSGTAILGIEFDRDYEIRDIQLRNLPSSGFFGQPIVYNQIVHAIQHRPSQRKYNILLSDSNKWEALS